MERPAPALIGSVAVHAGVVAAVVAALAWSPPPPPPNAMTDAVPVSIVSDTVIEAAAADNPGDEAVVEDAATAPPPEPTPAPPIPTPDPAPPSPAPTKTAPSPRPTPPRAAPPRPTPPRPTPPREPSLNLDALAGPPRPAPTTNPRSPTGERGAGTAPRASGAVAWQAIFAEVYRQWSPPCDTPGAEDLRIQMDVTISPRGQITRPPVLLGRRSDPVWTAVAEGAVRALYASAPFDVPQGFEGGTARTTFLTQRICGQG